MKSIVRYVYSVLLLGSFSGLLMSFGNDILAYMGGMCLFWACMLTPMLGAD